MCVKSSWLLKDECLQVLTSLTVHSGLLVPVRATTSPRRRALPSEKETGSPFMTRGRCYKGNGQVASHLSSGWLTLGPMWAGSLWELETGHPESVTLIGQHYIMIFRSTSEPLKFQFQTWDKDMVQNKGRWTERQNWDEEPTGKR